MNVGNLAITNNKGQVVIPSQIRKQLGITAGVPLKFAVWGTGMYVMPMEMTPRDLPADSGAVLAMLKRTQGTWGPESAEDKKGETRRRRLELAATKKARNAW